MTLRDFKDGVPIMKRFVITSIAILSFALVQAGLSVAARPSNGNVDQILANMQAAAAKITKLQARIRQEKLNKALGPPPEVYNGRLFFQHDGKNKDKVRITYYNGKGGVTQDILSADNKITIHQPAAGQAIVTTPQAAAGKNAEFSFIATPYQSVPQLKSRYAIQYKGDESVGSASTAVLELTPKGQSVASQTTIWVNRANWLPIKSRVVERNGDVSTFLLSDLSTGGAFSKSIFKIDLPQGTKILSR